MSHMPHLVWTQKNHANVVQVGLVSHAYLFKCAFWGEEKMSNCEFRGFDVFPDGSFQRVGLPDGIKDPVVAFCAYFPTASARKHTSRQSAPCDPAAFFIR